MNYLHEVMPRFYLDTKKYFDLEWPELSPQLDGLVVISRCDCDDPSCVEFSVEQTIKEYQTGAGTLHHYETTINEIYPYIGVQDERYLKEFDIRDDYRSGYINRCLNNIGLVRTDV